MNNKYNWKEIQEYYDQGYSIRDCRDQFGCALETIANAQKRGDFTSRGYGDLLPIEDLVSRSTVRTRVRKLNLIPYECAECGISEWLGRKLSLHLDHINGVSDDHRIDNLRWICPNCDSQSSTFAGRNVKHSRVGELASRQALNLKIGGSTPPS